MVKKSMAWLLSLIMCAALLGACSTTTDSEINKVELTVWNTQGTDYVYNDLDEDIPGDWLEEKTGVSVQNIYGNDGGQWDSKLTKLVAGDNLPDIIWCESGQGPSHFATLKKLGKLSSLTEDMVKKYAPNIWKRTPSHAWEEFKAEDGTLIGIPFKFDEGDLETVFYDYTDEELKNLKDIAVAPASGVVTMLSVRDDILKQIYPEAKSYDELMALVEETGEPIGDELFDVPIHTTEEFIDFMYKIKDLNLKEDGKTVYAFGYAGDGNDNWEAICYLGNMMYGGGNHEYTAHWNNATKKIEVPLATDFVKQMAKTQNQMVLDKVIDPESLAHTNAQFTGKIFNGQYAICAATRAGNYAKVNDQLKESGKNFSYRPLYIDIPAKEGYERNKVVRNFNSAFCILNTLSEEEVIQVLKWADLQYTDEFMEIYNWGREEDALYTDNEDGTRTFNDDSFNQFFIESDSTALECRSSKGLGGMANRFYVLPFDSTKWSHKVYNKVTKLVPTATSAFGFKNDSPYVTSVMAAPPSSAYSSEFSGIDEVATYWAKRDEWETATKKAFAASEGQFDAKWNEMLNVLNNTVDIKTMEEKMTDVALEYWNALEASAE